MKEIILASNNKGKIREMKEILSPLGFYVLSQKEAGIKLEVEETGTTFAENSSLKAIAIYDITKKAVIADDSGLMVDALNGAPGVYSHRFAGENATDTDRCNFLLDKLKDVAQEKRTARFCCNMCYINENGEEKHVEGFCKGKIAEKAKGNNGFGYDPVFLVEGDKFNRTMAELSDIEKNQISHRGKALEKMKEILKNEN